MIFHSSRRKIENSDNLIIDNYVINRVESTKFIGVTLDSKLTWSNHIRHTRQKVARGVGVLRKVRRLLSEKTMLTLYNSLIFPYFIYCIEVWGNAAHKYLWLLLKLQKRCVRIIKSVGWREHTNPLFKNLKILPLTLLYKQRILIFIFKFVKCDLPDIFNEVFRLNEQNVTTRQQFNLRVDICRTELYKKTIRFSGVSEWNKIVNLIDRHCSIYTFKKRLRNFLLCEL